MCAGLNASGHRKTEFLSSHGLVLGIIAILNKGYSAWIAMTVVFSSFYFVGKVRKIGLERKTKWIDVVVSKDTLLNANFKWNAKVREDLNLGPTYIDLNSHLLNFMKCLDKINHTLLNEQFPLLSKESLGIKRMT